MIPALEKYVFATTNKRNANLQKEILLINKERKKNNQFTIDILFWEDLCSILADPGNSDLLEKFYGSFINSLPGLPAFPAPDNLVDPGALPVGSRMLFTRNKVFTGRTEDLLRLAKVLAIPSNQDKPVENINPQVAVITGMGGLGKSQLAVEYCYRYGRYYRGVHWLQANQDLNLEIAECGRQMGSAALAGKTAGTGAGHSEAWEKDRRRLVVLDNLEDLAVLVEWLPKIGGCVLATSRRGDWPRDLNLEILALGTLNRPESRELLRKLAPRLNQELDSSLDRLADRLGDLPLALDLAGRYLDDRQRLGIESYLAEIDRAGQTPEHKSFVDWSEHNPTDHDTHLASIWQVSWQQLEEEKAENIAARQVFMMCGYCEANIPIPQDVLEDAINSKEGSFDRALKRLYGLGLLARTEQGPSIHPLLAEFARFQNRKADDSVLRELGKVLRSKIVIANKSGFPGKAIPYQPHIQTVGTALNDIEPATTASLWNNLGYLLDSMGDYFAAHPYYEQALALRRQVLGEKHPDTASSLNNLGYLLQSMGDYPMALQYYEQALAINKEMLGEKHPVTAISLNNLGALLNEMGDNPRRPADTSSRPWRSTRKF